MFNLFIMKHIIFNDPYNKKNIFSVIYIENQFLIIEKLYNDISCSDISCSDISCSDISCSDTSYNNIQKEYEKEIKKKLNSYKNQDKQKNKFDNDQMITYNQIIIKLYESKLKCYYCNCEMVILFNKKREGVQWTLERLNNNIGHYDSNTCISCLKCNLQRRTDNYEYFKKGKQLKINIIK